MCNEVKVMIPAAFPLPPLLPRQRIDHTAAHLFPLPSHTFGRKTLPNTHPCFQLGICWYCEGGPLPVPVGANGCHCKWGADHLLPSDNILLLYTSKLLGFKCDWEFYLVPIIFFFFNHLDESGFGWQSWYNCDVTGCDDTVMTLLVMTPLTDGLQSAVDQSLDPHWRLEKTDYWKI